MIRFPTLVHAAACALAALLTTLAAHAQDFPQKPIRLILPYTPGGSTDVLGRTLAELLRKDMGQPVIVDNRPGANTGVGAQALATAPADGYTLLLGTAATVVLNPLLYPKLAYDPAALMPVARVAISPLVIVAKGDSPLRNMGDLLERAKAEPGKLTFASTGVGSTLHLAGELLQRDTGAKMLHVPYKGSSPALTGLLGGETDVFIDAVGSSIPLIKDGKIRALAVTSGERLAALPAVPTVAEAGVANYDVSTWFGLLAPRGTPDDIVARLNAAVAKATADKAFRDQFEALGLIIPAALNPKAFAAYVGSEGAKWAPIIKANNISLE